MKQTVQIDDMDIQTVDGTLPERKARRRGKSDYDAVVERILASKSLAVTMAPMEKKTRSSIVSGVSRSAAEHGYSVKSYVADDDRLVIMLRVADDS